MRTLAHHFVATTAIVACLASIADAAPRAIFRETSNARPTAEGGSTGPGPATPACALTVDTSGAAGFPEILSDKPMLISVVPKAPLPQGGHFQIEQLPNSGDVSIGNDASFDPSTGRLSFVLGEADDYSYRIDYVPDTEGAFVGCSTPAISFSSRLDESLAQVFQFRQCTDPGFGYDGLAGAGYAFSYNKPLLEGMVLDQADGKIYGTITAPVGSYKPYRLRIDTQDPATMFGDIFQFDILPANEVFYVQGTPDGKVGVAYTLQFGHANGIGGAYTYSFDPPLPSWLVLDTSLEQARYGYVYRGTPSAPSTYSGTATLTSSCGVKSSKPLTFKVLP